MSKNIVFAGTPDFAAYNLQALIDNGLIPTLVMTQPDRAAGRGRKLTPSPVKIIAEKYDIPIYQPEKFDDEVRAYFDLLVRPDLMIVVAYGLLLPQWALDWAQYGAVNVHASLLPRWRGAAPIQRAIEAGDKESGVGVMQMDIGLDTGDVWVEARVGITDETNAQQLHDTLQSVGSQVLIEVIPDIFAGEKKPIPQAIDGVAYAKKLTKSEAQVNWNESSEMICRKIRAFNPVPIAHSETASGIRFRFYDAVPVRESHEVTNGTVLSESKDGVTVACEGGAVAITELQEVGKKRLFVKDFLNGKSLLGEVFL